MNGNDENKGKYINNKTKRNNIDVDEPGNWLLGYPVSHS